MTTKRAQPHLPGIGGSGAVARVRRYVDRQLHAQRSLGQLEPVDAGLIGLAMTLADSIDAEVSDPDGSRFTVGALAGRLLPVLLELRGERVGGAADGVDVELVALTHAFRDATRSVAPDPRPRDPRPPDPPA